MIISTCKPPTRIVISQYQLAQDSTYCAGLLRFGTQPIHVAGLSGEIVATIEPILKPLDFAARDQQVLFRLFVRDLPDLLSANRPLVLTYYGKLLGIFKPKIKE